MNLRLSSTVALAAISTAALAAILLLIAFAPASAQSDAPMVITPQPADQSHGTEPSGPGPDAYRQGSPEGWSNGDPGGPGRPYQPAPQAGESANGPYVPPEAQDHGSFSIEEINEAGHRFFGRVSMSFAEAVEYTFQRAGRPNGYILGEEAGGAFIAGLRYGEGMLYTKDAGDHKVFWQGPSVGYDFGGEGSKTMVLVYNLQSPGEIYRTYAGVDGSAYLVGGVGVTFLARDHVVLAPIRSGLGLRLGANIGYLKYTREPTWNPF
jgi:hypothetical protein